MAFPVALPLNTLRQKYVCITTGLQESGTEFTRTRRQPRERPKVTCGLDAKEDAEEATLHRWLARLNRLQVKFSLLSSHASRVTVTIYPLTASVRGNAVNCLCNDRDTLLHTEKDNRTKKTTYLGSQ